MSVPSIESLASRAAALIPPAGGRAVLGIAGPPGAGKSTLVRELMAAFAEIRPGSGAAWFAHVPMDGFHLADAQLERLGIRDRKGAPETFDAAGYAACLQRIASSTGTDVYVPGFERGLEQPIAAALLVPGSARLIITEGNYLLLDSADWPHARAVMDEVWYCRVDESVRRERLIARHVEFGKPAEDATEWVDRSDEINARLVAGTATTADLIVERD